MKSALVRMGQPRRCVELIYDAQWKAQKAEEHLRDSRYDCLKIAQRGLGLFIVEVFLSAPSDESAIRMVCLCLKAGGIGYVLNQVPVTTP